MHEVILNASYGFAGVVLLILGYGMIDVIKFITPAMEK